MRCLLVSCPLLVLLGVLATPVVGQETSPKQGESPTVKVGVVYHYSIVREEAGTKLASGERLEVLEVKENKVKWRRTTVSLFKDDEGKSAEGWWEPAAGAKEGAREETLAAAGRKWTCRVDERREGDDSVRAWIPQQNGRDAFPPELQVIRTGPKGRSTKTLTRITERVDLSHVKVGQVYVYKSVTSVAGSVSEMTMRYEVVALESSRVQYRVVMIVAGAELPGPEDWWETAGDDGGQANEEDAEVEGGAAVKVKTRRETVEVAGKKWECLVVESEAAGTRSATWIPQRGGQATWPMFLKTATTNEAGGLTTTLSLERVEEPRPKKQ